MNALRAATGLALVATAACMAACDPCSGIASCHVPPTVGISGQVIDFVSGKAIAGTTVSFAPAAGAALAGPLTGTSDALGQFQLSGEASTDGTVTGDLTVRAPTFPAGYTVHGFQMGTSRTKGGGTDIGRVLAQPYISFVGQVTARLVGGGLGGSAEIQRTGGATLANGDVTVPFDTSGLFYFHAAAGSFDSVVVNLTFSSPGVPNPSTYSGVVLPVIWQDQVPAVNRVFSVGASLAYAVQAFHRGLQVVVPGVGFSWTRVGGIATTPTALAGVTDQYGLFSLQTQPSGEGTVFGNIVMTPAAPYAPQSYPNVALTTFDNDSLRLLATYNFGPAAQYVGELFNRGTGALQPGVAVDFIPTGGVPASPRTDTSNSAGRFLVAPYTAQDGIVIGDLHFHYLPPRTPEVVTGVQLQTYQDDSLRYLQRWGVGPSLLYVGELHRSDNFAPLVGAQVTFQRTSGIAVSPDPLISTSIAGGRFSLNLAPSTDGTVTGNLSVHSPPLRDTTFTISMTTFLTDSVRLLSVWLINP